MMGPIYCPERSVTNYQYRGWRVTFKLIHLVNGYLELLPVFFQCTFRVPLKTWSYEL